MVKENIFKSNAEHWFFWVFMFMFIFDYHFMTDNLSQALFYSLAETMGYMIVFYINLNFLVPTFLQKNKLPIYIVNLVLIAFAYVLTIKFTGLEHLLYEYSGLRNIFSMILNFSLFIMISCLYWYYHEWSVEKEKKLILKNQNLEYEMNFLRNQINPHFIFNSLNNIYSLALQKHDNTGPMVSKLSHIMRYMVFNTHVEKVTLERELSVIQDYIDMHMFRQPLSKNMVYKSEGDFNAWMISPMMLIDFVENAFKHSNIHQDPNAWVLISAVVDENGMFIFQTENNSENPETTGKGVGMVNIKRQLEIKYKDRFVLETKKENNIFKLYLSIQL